MNVNLAGLKKTHGDKAEEIFAKVAQIGGFGDIEPNNPGGLDITGLSDAKKAEVEKLLEAPKTDENKQKAGK